MYIRTHSRCPLNSTRGGSRIDCRGGLSIPRALARTKFYVLHPLLDCRGGAKYIARISVCEILCATSTFDVIFKVVA